MIQSNPIHVKILSGYYFLFAFLIAAGGLIYLTASDWLLKVIPENDYFLQMTQSDFALWGGVLLVVAGLEAWLAIALLRTAKVARIIAIVISAMGLIWAIFGLAAYAEPLNIFFLIVHSYFLWVLFYKYHRSLPVDGVA